MIQANELRIGNWVETYPSSKIEQVYDLMCDCINTKTKEKLPFDCVDPIPLTPEILEKCGFEKSQAGNSWYLSIPQLKAEIHFENFRFELICVLYCSTGSFVPNSIIYLHQLQNLYFALTGEELECNLCK